MSESKTYVFQPDTNNALANLMPLLQQRGIDPSVLAMLGNNHGIFGGNGWDGIIALVVIAAIFGWGGNGNGIFGGRGNGGSAERDMIMSAIQRNGTDIATLASSVNCSEGQIMSAINNVATQICNLSASEGQNSMQIINALQAGNNTLMSKLCDCCCENRLAIANQTNALTSRIDQLANGITQGFSATAYETAQQTCALRENADNNARSILAKLDQIEDSRKDREINNLTAQLTAANSRAERAAELAPIYKALNDIQCKQPTTVTTPYQPFVAVPNCVAAQMGLYGSGFYNGGNGGGFL